MRSFYSIFQEYIFIYMLHYFININVVGVFYLILSLFLICLSLILTLWKMGLYFNIFNKKSTINMENDRLLKYWFFFLQKHQYLVICSRVISKVWLKKWKCFSILISTKNVYFSKFFYIPVQIRICIQYIYDSICTDRCSK